MKTLVFFVFCIIIGLTLAAATSSACGNGRDEQSMKCRGEFFERGSAATVLAADTVTEEPTKNEVEQIIRARLTPFTGKITECSFKCNHKQKEFDGCNCATSIKYNTTLAKCPDDVTRVSSTSLKWAWDQCQELKCDCALIDDTIADQRTLYAHKVLDKIQPIRKNGDLNGFYHVIRKTFTTSVLGYQPEGFTKNLKHYIARAVRKISSFLNLAKVTAFFGQTFKAIATGVKAAFESVKNFFGRVGGAFVNLVKKNRVIRAVSGWLKKKFGFAGGVIAKAFKGVKAIASAAGKAFKKVYNAIKNNPLVRKFIGGVKKVYGLAKAGIKKLGGMAKKFGVKLGKGFKKGLLKARNGFKKLGNGVKKTIRKIGGGIRKFGRGLKKGFNKAKDGLKKGIRKFGTGLRKFSSGLKNGFRKIGGGIKKDFGKAKKAIGNGFRKLGNGFRKLGSGVRKFESKIASGFNKVTTGFNKFTGGFEKASSSVVSHVGNGIEKAGDVAKKGFSKAKSFLSRI